MIAVLWRWIDRWIPAPLLEVEESKIRARALLAISGMYALANTIFTVGFLLDGNLPIAALEGGIALVVLCTPVVLSRTGQLATATYFISGALFLETANLLWGMHRLPAFLFSVIALVPLGVRFLSGVDRLRLWIGVVFGMYGLMIGAGALQGWEIEQLNPGYFNFFVEASVFFGVLMAIAWVQQGIHGIALRRAEEARVLAEEAKARAEEALQARTVFLAAMSHEIRTPLNGVIGLSRVLQDAGMDDESRETARLIEHSGDRLLQMLGNVLDLAQLESGAMTWVHAAFSRRRVVERVVAAWRPLAEKKRLTLSLVWREGSPDWVVGDEARLEQILSTLLHNAIKFTPSGGVGLRVQGEAIEVWDTGLGIRKERLKELFQPFSQLHTADTSLQGFHTRPFEGAGVGLAVCWRLTTGLGGQMAVTPREGGGTSFLLSFPFPAAEPPLETRGGLARPGWGLRVLVVDDNPINLKVAIRQVERLGCQVWQASGGEEALALVAAQPVDIILMDCQMPGVDGFEATRQLRAREGTRQHTRVVALTAHQGPHDREQAFDAGMDAFLPKPLKVDALAAVVRRFGLVPRGALEEEAS